MSFRRIVTVNNDLWAEYLVDINRVLAKINDGKYLNKSDKYIIVHVLENLLDDIKYYIKTDIRGRKSDRHILQEILGDSVATTWEEERENMKKICPMFSGMTGKQVQDMAIKHGYGKAVDHHLNEENNGR